MGSAANRRQLCMGNFSLQNADRTSIMARSGLTPKDWVKVVLVAGIGTILEWVSAQPPVPLMGAATSTASAGSCIG